MNYKKEIIQKICNPILGFSQYQMFTDFVQVTALALANASTSCGKSIWKKREGEYLQIMKKYGKAGSELFPELLGMLTKTMDEELSDVLGEIYMESGCGNKYTGQFFTPYHVSLMTAQLSLPPEDWDGWKDGREITLNEPSCGSGGMIIAVAEILRKRGIDYQKRLKVVAQDLDWKAVYMCYVQLCLYGINAVVVQGDTLMDPYHSGYPEERVFRTPRNRGMLL